MKDAELYSAEIADELPSKTADGTTVNKSVFEDNQYVTIPASVFRYCGYDSIQVVVTDKYGNVIEESGQKLVAMGRPMNLKLNGGKAITLRAGESADTTLTYDTTVFVEDSSVVYTMSDPGVAEVDENGTVTPVGNGKTVLTATLLPSGTKADIPVTVKGISGTEPEPEPAPAITVEVSGDEGSVAVIAAQTEGEQPGGVVAWYLPEEGGKVKSPTSVKYETATFTVRHFSNYALSYDETLPAACLKDETCPMTAYTDLDKSLWYHDGVHWALANGVMNGIGDGLFDPTGATSRVIGLVPSFFPVTIHDTRKAEHDE